jgi:hypothetical protein
MTPETEKVLRELRREMRREAKRRETSWLPSWDRAKGLRSAAAMIDRELKRGKDGK